MEAIIFQYLVPSATLLFVICLSILALVDSDKEKNNCSHGISEISVARHQMIFASEIRKLKAELEQHYLDQVKEIDFGVGDTIKVGGVCYRINKIDLSKCQDELDAISIEATAR